MPNDLFYLSHILVFSVPVLVFLWCWKRHVLKKNMRVLVFTAVFGLVFQIITESIGLTWDAWKYSGAGILGIWIGNFPIEELVLAALFSFTLAAVIVVLIDWKERGRFRFFLGAPDT